jgi:hypothetical protein
MNIKFNLHIRNKKASLEIDWNNYIVQWSQLSLNLAKRVKEISEISSANVMIIATMGQVARGPSRKGRQVVECTCYRWAKASRPAIAFLPEFLSGFRKFLSYTASIVCDSCGASSPTAPARHSELIKDNTI